ncbi:MAG: hypothetical protein Q4F97_02385 [Bacteroidales bacterium]|nr:hypothetical protein [Bacteroidales bacterium]
MILLLVIKVLLSVNLLLPVTLNAGRKNNESYSFDVIKDKNFNNGFAVSPLTPKEVIEKGGFKNANIDTLSLLQSKKSPDWQLCQWHSKFPITKHDLFLNNDSLIIYKNEAKEIRYNKKDSSILLKVFASKEYYHPRTVNEDWVHLLIQQDFDKMPNIEKSKHIYLSFSVRLIECENKMKDDEFDSNIHTAQAPFYLYLRNTNKNSVDYNHALWLGISTFDYRYPNTLENDNVHLDKGTNTYIYTTSQTEFWGNISFQDKKWHETSVDIKPIIVKAVEKLKGKNVFNNTSLSDIEITGMNFGWEIPGTFDAAIVIKAISLNIIE